MAPVPPESQGARNAVQGRREARQHDCDLVAVGTPPPTSTLSYDPVGEPLPRKPPLRLKRELLSLIGSDCEAVVANDLADRERDWTCCAGSKGKADAKE
jgi:hypothetical protein